MRREDTADRSESAERFDDRIDVVGAGKGEGEYRTPVFGENARIASRLGMNELAEGEGSIGDF